MQSSATKQCKSIGAEKKAWECSLCGAKLLSLIAFEGHLISHETRCFDNPKKCFYCDKKLQDAVQFKVHIHEAHVECVQLVRRKDGSTNSYHYKCVDCDYKNTIPILEVHYKNNHTEIGKLDVYKCDHCPVEFYDRQERNIHTASHLISEGIVEFHCQECSVSFQKPTEFAVHYNEHYSQRPFACAFCPRKFIATASCISHENSKHRVKLSARHSNASDGLSIKERRNIELRGWEEMLVPGPERNETNQLAYSCKDCENKFYGTIKFQMHIETHKEPQYSCEKCDYHTKSRSHLRQHTNIRHNENRPFACQSCGTTFKVAAMLNGHAKVHDKKKYCKIDHCGEELEDEYTYVLHVRQEHGGTHKCTYCELKFSSIKRRINHEQNSHAEVLTEECNICGEKFKQLFSLKLHIKLHQPSGQKCTLCQQEFQDEYSLIGHANSEHDGRVYKCASCEAVLQTKTLLGVHRRIIHNEFLPKYKEVASDGLTKVERRYLELSGWGNSLTPNLERNQNNELAYVCQHCGKKICGTKEFKRHLQSHEEHSIKCDECSYTTNRNALLRKHMKRHAKNQKIRLYRTLKNARKITAGGHEENKNKRRQCSAETVKLNSPDNSLSIREQTVSSSALPMAVVLSNELLRKENSTCIIWTSRLECDILSIASSYPTRCYICVLDDDTNKSGNEGLEKQVRNLNKMRIFIKFHNKKIVNLSCYSSRSLQLNSSKFASFTMFEASLKDRLNQRNVVHLTREGSTSNRLSSQELETKMIVCNCVKSKKHTKIIKTVP